MKVPVLLLCSLLVSPILTAQEETYFSEIMEVRVTNVDVVVTGKDGKPVTGLKPEDFEIYEDGVQKEITNFLEMRGAPSGTLTTVQGEATAPPDETADDIRRRDVTIFIDNAVLNPLRRNQVLPLLEGFIRDAVRPGDSVAIAVWNRSLKIELEPTSDRAAIEAAVKGLRSSVTAAGADAQAKEEYYRELADTISIHKSQDLIPEWIIGVSAARGYANKASHGLNQRVEAVKSVIAWRRGVEGRKILVLLTHELPMNPAEEAFLYLDSIKDQFVGVNSMAMSEAREFEFPSIITEVTEVANSSGVTVYPIDVAGKSSGMPDATPRRRCGSEPAGTRRLRYRGSPWLRSLRKPAASR
jgi:VWFA-related protein